MSERFHGGSPVPGGYYLNPSRWAIEPVQRDGDRLPPGPGEWRRIPMVVALALVPILGVTFLMFMPAAGFLVLGKHLWDLARRPFARKADAAAEAKPAARADAERPAADR
jgi:hypothetical protein